MQQKQTGCKKLSPLRKMVEKVNKEKICLKCQTYFSGKNKKNVINLKSSSGFARESKLSNKVQFLRV